MAGTLSVLAQLLLLLPKPIRSRILHLIQNILLPLSTVVTPHPNLVIVQDMYLQLILTFPIHPPLNPSMISLPTMMPMTGTTMMMTTMMMKEN